MHEYDYTARYNPSRSPMTPERWQAVKDVCQRALDCDPNDRDAFLAEACLGDPELRHEVETLLTQSTYAEGILDTPIWEQRGTWLPKQIGRYRVLRLVGE